MSGGHDQLFKDLIRSFPADFLNLTAPEVLAQIESQDLDLQPAEVFIDLPRGAQRHLDLVARVRTRAGEPTAVLLNVEIELRYRAAVPARLWSYNRQLSLRYGLLVHTFVLYLRGGAAGVRTAVHRESSLGREVCCFHYTSFGLSGASAEAYLARPEPLAWAFAALMRWPGNDCFAQRRACLERIARERNLDGARSFLLFNCVATYLELDGRARELYEGLLAGQREGNQAMMTWAEKFEAQAVERGRQEGLMEGLRGMREMLLRLLERRFAPLPGGLPQRLAAIDSAEELTRLAEKVLSARSLEEMGLA
jgi:hypothetical protein